jgi:hypothetical protein
VFGRILRNWRSGWSFSLAETLSTMCLRGHFAFCDSGRTFQPNRRIKRPSRLFGIWESDSGWLDRRGPIFKNDRNCRGSPKSRATHDSIETKVSGWTEIPKAIYECIA